MPERLTLAAVSKLLDRLAHSSGGATTRERLERLAALAAANPKADELGVGDVLIAVFADEPEPLERFRELRHRLRALARREDVVFDCVMDGHKRAASAQRRCWFLGEPVFDWIERHSLAASKTPQVTVKTARGRREIRTVCIDFPPPPEPGDKGEPVRMQRLACELAEMIERALSNTTVAIAVTDTKASAGELPLDIRKRRLADADLVICLLTREYVRRYGDDAASAGRSALPVALEPLADDEWPEALGLPFDRGQPFDHHDNKPRLVEQLCKTVRRRVMAPTDDAWLTEAAWLPDAADPGPVVVVKALALPAALDRRIPMAHPRDDAVLVQDHLAAWADDPSARPYLVIFGEYGMGKTTACKQFTRRLIERRRRGDHTARRPILFDLRDLGPAGRAASTLEGLLADLLDRSWHDSRDPRPHPTEVVRLVQERGAVVIFDGLDEVLIHLDDREGQALLRRLWSILPPALLHDEHRRAAAGHVLFTCRTHFFRTIADQHAYFRGADRDA
ncbi:MAG: NACHT domain-containing protein, partial [Burkholderiales bacterium]